MDIREATCHALGLSLSIISNPFTPYALAVIPLCNGGKTEASILSQVAQLRSSEDKIGIWLGHAKTQALPTTDSGEVVIVCMLYPWH